MKILGAVLELNSTSNPAHSPQNWAKLAKLARSSKMAPMILIFSIAMAADYSVYVKSITTYVPAFLGYNNSVLARVRQPDSSKPSKGPFKYYVSLFLDFLGPLTTSLLT